MASLKKHLIIAFNAYRRNFATLIASIIIITLASLIFAIPAALLVTLESERFQSNESFQPSLNFQSLFLLDSIGVAFALLLLGLLVTIYLSSGFVGVCYYGVRRKVKLNTFLKVIKKRGISYFLATAILGLIFLMILLSFTVFLISFHLSEEIMQLFLRLILLLILPFFVLYGPAIIAGKRVVNSIEQSIKLGINNYFSLLALSLIFVATSSADLIAQPIISLAISLINYFFVMPIFQISLCSIYIEKTKRR